MKLRDAGVRVGQVVDKIPTSTFIEELLEASYRKGIHFQLSFYFNRTYKTRKLAINPRTCWRSRNVVERRAEYQLFEVLPQKPDDDEHEAGAW